MGAANADQPGPLHENGMCLLDWPLRLHLKPNASARSIVEVPQVAAPPGPTSDPGGLIVCTRLPGGVVGPVSASAFASTLPGIAARQCARSPAISTSIGANSRPRISAMP